MAREGNTTVLGLVAIIIGVLLVMGGMMFLLATATAILLGKEVPPVLLMPGIAQVLLGLLGSTGGFSLRRGNGRAKLLLLFVAIGVVLNVVLLFGIVAVTVILASRSA